jgi:hypothetical protein
LYRPIIGGKRRKKGKKKEKKENKLLGQISHTQPFQSTTSPWGRYPLFFNIKIE